MKTTKSIFWKGLAGAWLLMVMGATVQADTYPRLLIDADRLQDIRDAVDVPGSTHAEILAVMQADVDATADYIIGGSGRTGNNWNYARNFLARKAAMVYAVTEDPQYAQIAYDALYAVHNDPDPAYIVPEEGKGLERATVGKGFAIAYDLCYNGWTQQQRDYIRGKINVALDAWPSFNFINVNHSPFGSNWVAVTRGAELLMMLAVDQQGARSNRFNDLKSWLDQHMQNYGNTGWTQEGNYYMSYGGQFLIPALIALRNIGDTSLDNTAESKNMYKIALYGGMFNAAQESTQWGVGGQGFGPQGWTSLLFEMVPEDEKPYYRWFYDRHRGILNPSEPELRYDRENAGNVFAMMFYPQDVPAMDPGDFYERGIEDSYGGYWFRDRWQDADDVIVSLGTDTVQHRHAWDEADAMQINIMAFGSKFAGGPATSRQDSRFSQVTVNGQARTSTTATGDRVHFEVDDEGGYAIAGGGMKYGGLGLTHAQRHVKVDYPLDRGFAMISTLDDLQSNSIRTYGWQLNEMNLPVTVSEEEGVQTFTLDGKEDGYLKGWVMYPRDVTISDGNPLKFEVVDSSTQIWVVMVTGRGAAPHAEVVGEAFDATLRVGDRIVSFDESTNRIVSEDAPDQRPLARFSANPPSGTAPHTVQFDATDTLDPHGDVQAYEWDFGDGGTASGLSPEYAFQLGGRYPVTLTVTDSSGYQSRATQIITVENRSPLAALSTDVTAGDPPLTVNFDGSASSDPDGHNLTYSWDFGDGYTAGDTPITSHTYTEQGRYFAVLTVSDGHGGIGTRSQVIEVGNQAPTPAFTHSDTFGIPPVTVHFDATDSTDPEGDPLTYSWDFGDGGTATGATPSHTFTEFGDFPVTLTVDDGEGNSVELTQNLRIQNLPPNPSFTFSPNGGNAPRTITFDASGSSDPEGQPLTFSWDFGDGGTATGVNPAHTFNEPGNYLVTLTVTDAQGAENQAVRGISILDEGLRAPDNPDNLFPGIYYQLFGLNERFTPNFDQLVASREGVMYNIDIRNREGDERFAFRYTGYIKVPEDGTYTFHFAFRDTLTVKFGGQTVIEYDDLAFSRRTANHSIGLKAGYHQIELLYHMGDLTENDQWPELTMEWEGPGFDRRYMESTDFFWQGGRPTSAFDVSPAPENMIVPESVNFIPDDPVGTRTFYQTEPGEPLTLNFEAGPSVAPGSEIIAYLWDFGYDNSGTGRTASHSFSPGEHVVTLTVRTADGGIVTSGQTIFVLPAPERLNRAREFGRSVTVSDEDPSVGGSAVNVFEDDIDTRWLTWDLEGWIEIHFDHNGFRQSYVIDEYSVVNPPAWNDRDAEEIRFYGSHDGVNWDLLDHREDLVWPDTHYTWFFDVDNDVAYSSYRWELRATNPSPQGDILEVRELGLFDNGTGNQPVTQNPVAHLTGPDAAQVLEPVTFDASDSFDPDNTPLMYFWDLGDGQTRRTYSPILEHIYYAPDNYTVTVYARDSMGGLDSATHHIDVTPSVNNPPVATFEVTQSGDTFYFDATASSDPDGDPLTFLWDFGDSGGAMGPEVSHTYNFGVYSAVLTVFDDKGAQSVYVQEVHHFPAHTPDSININICERWREDLLIFPFEYAGAIPSPYWNNIIGGNTTSLMDSEGNSSGASISFQSFGFNRTNDTFPIVTANHRLLTSYWGINPNQPTRANLNGIPYDTYDLYIYWAGGESDNGITGTMEITIDGETKYIRDDNHRWDGALTESTAATAEAAEDGDVYVVFRGLTNSNIQIYAEGVRYAAPAGYQIVDASEPNLPPVVDFTATPESGDAPLEVNFNAANSYDPDGTIVLYEWDFLGDGNWVEGNVTASHTYYFPGEYSPALRLTDDRGDTSADTVDLVVTGDPPPNVPPEGVAEATPSLGQFPLEVSFDGSASQDPDGEIVLYEWDFTNNGSVDATGVTVAHTYPDPGIYTARLRVTDNDGDFGEDFVEITVTETSPDSVLIVDWGQTESTGEIRDGNDPEAFFTDLSGNGQNDDLILTYPFSASTPLSPTSGGYTDVPMYGGIRLDALSEDDLTFAERTLADHFALRPAGSVAGAGGGTLISWGPGTDIHDSWTTIGDDSTDEIPGGINGNNGGFTYRSHTTAIVTNTNYTNPPDSPDFGHASSHWESGGSPNVRYRIEGREEGGDFIQINNFSSGSNYGANLVWWELDQAHDTSELPLRVISQTEGGDFALAVLNDGQWYLGEVGQTNVDSLDDIDWVPYHPVDGNPHTMFANYGGGDTIGSLAGLTFAPETFDAITALGIYNERIDETQGRDMKIREFTVEVATPAPWIDLQFALLWDQEDFLNDGDIYAVSFSHDSHLRIHELETDGLENQLRWLVRDGSTYYLSHALVGNAGLAELTFAAHDDDGLWTVWDPQQGYGFDAAQADWQTQNFSDVTAVGLALPEGSFINEAQLVRFDRFEVAARLSPQATDAPFDVWLQEYDYTGFDPDTYEVRKGGRMVTLREAFLLGADPNDPNDLPRLRMMNPDELQFDTLPNRRYQVEWSEDLVEWTPLEDTFLRTSGDREEVQYPVFNPGDMPRRFYRLRIEFPQE
ncbi:MAG: PKD domain-containing protein [Opitutales bacterium]|nr:PKD domain-containing protein [Opitutales bacterium]